MSVPSNAAFSIPTTHSLTWEAWIRPDTLQFPKNSSGYVDWMGKCQDYSPTCEWEARLYNTTNSEDRCNRFSAYVFNNLSLIHISEPTRQAETSYAVFCLKKKNVE